MDRVSSCQLLWAQRRCCIINVLTWGPGSPGIPLGPGWPLTPLAPCRDNMDSMTLVTISQSDYHNVSDLIAHLWTWSTWGARESWSSWLSRWTLQEHTHRDTHTVSAGCLSDDWCIKQDLRAAELLSYLLTERSSSSIRSLKVNKHLMIHAFVSVMSEWHWSFHI